MFRRDLGLIVVALVGVSLVTPEVARATTAPLPGAPAVTPTFHTGGERRVFDSRVSPGRRVAAGSVTRIDTTPAGVGPSARAVVLNVTGADAAGAGFLTVHACDTVRPPTSTLNFIAGPRATANLAVTPASATGQVCIYASARTHLIVDVMGEFPATSGYAPAGPSRVLDTRQAESAQLRLTAGSSIALDEIAELRDREPVVVVTAVGADGPGFLSLLESCESWAAEELPQTSVVNFDAGVTVANTVFLRTSDTPCLYASAAVDVVVDVVGYMDGTSAFARLCFCNFGPTRLVDTRVTERPQPGSVTVVPWHPGGPHPDATVVTVTAINGDEPGYLTLFPCGSPIPETSTVNFVAGEVRANTTIVRRGAEPQICLFASTGVDILVDQANVQLPMADAPLWVTTNGHNGCGAGGLFQSDTRFRVGSTMTLTPSGGIAPYVLDVSDPPGWTVEVDGGTVRMWPTDASTPDGATAPIDIRVTDAAGTIRSESSTVVHPLHVLC